jgi:hypothetical protein
MRVETGYLIKEGKIPIPDDVSIGELFQLMTGAVLEDDGNIWCMNCNRPNECCECHLREENHDK